MKGLKALMLAGFLLFLAVLLIVITLGLALPIALPLIVVALIMIGMGISGRRGRKSEQADRDSER